MFKSILAKDEQGQVEQSKKEKTIESGEDETDLLPHVGIKKGKYNKYSK